MENNREKNAFFQAHLNIQLSLFWSMHISSVMIPRIKTTHNTDQYSSVLVFPPKPSHILLFQYSPFALIGNASCYFVIS